MFNRDIGIDLGTANVLIQVKGKGIVLDEPSIVAMDTNTRKVLAVGDEAHRMVGRTPGNIVATRPLKDGVIADFDVTEIMLKHFIQKIGAKRLFSSPNILICCPTDITSVEKKAIRETAEKSGAKKVYIEEEPKVAAVGAGMDIMQPHGNMVVDIGGGTTDIAVLSMGDIVTASSIKLAGDQFDQAIQHYVKKKYKLLIGERTAEEVKKAIAIAFPDAREDEIDIRGRDLVSGLPKTINLTSNEVYGALEESLAQLVLTCKGVLEETPPELAADIIDKGIFITGGGALLYGIEQLLSRELGVPVLIAEDPLTCVAKGTGLMLDFMDKLPKKSVG